MEYQDLLYFLEHVNTDPSRLIFEDKLTGIYNRRFLRRYLQHKIQWDSLEREPASLLMMDVDSLKQINDTYGHSVGDQALVWVAKLIKEVAGVNGLAVRYGGDEFIVLMPAADKRAALEVGEQILQRIKEEPLHLDEIVGQLPITLSIRDCLGSCRCPDGQGPHTDSRYCAVFRQEVWAGAPRRRRAGFSPGGIS